MRVYVFGAGGHAVELGAGVLEQSFQNKQAMKTIHYKASNCYAILESLY